MRLLLSAILTALLLNNHAPAVVRGSDGATAPHFHHIHLNATDPASAIQFYTSKFDCEKARFAGSSDAVWAQKSWFLFNKVKTAPPSELTSAVWHFGWGAEDMKSTYQKQIDGGTKFFTPITELAPNFYYAYVDAPDHALVELNTANHHQFGHLHLFSEDPVSAGEWYMKNLGATRRGGSTTPPSREARWRNGFQIGPAMSLMSDNVNIIIYPIQYSKQAYPSHWKPGQTAMSSTRGRVVDHIAFSVDNVADALAKLRSSGIRIIEDVKAIPGTKIKSAFIEGPDKIVIEIVEGRE